MKKTIRILAVIFAIILIIPTTVFAKDGDIPFESSRFIDVKESSWYYDAVMYVSNEGLMLGVDETHFAPKQNITRAQLVTVLCRLAGVSYGYPVPAPFKDVKDGKWYSFPVAWASQWDIVVGYEDGTFKPDRSITRSEMATVLSRFAERTVYDWEEFETVDGTLDVFPDAEDVQTWAERPLSWAVSNGLIGGTEKNGRAYLDPQGSATRAQVAAIISRFCDFVDENPKVYDSDPSYLPEYRFNVPESLLRFVSSMSEEKLAAIKELEDLRDYPLTFLSESEKEKGLFGTFRSHIMEDGITVPLMNGKELTGGLYGITLNLSNTCRHPQIWYHGSWADVGVTYLEPQLAKEASEKGLAWLLETIGPDSTTGKISTTYAVDGKMTVEGEEYDVIVTEYDAIENEVSYGARFLRGNELITVNTFAPDRVLESLSFATLTGKN